MRILVVEDEKKIASFIAKGLREQGFQVEVCHNGDDAYNKVLSQPFDLLVLDIMLPGRDGLSILKNLREQKNGVPIILLTARGELHERLEGFQLGADDYLPKPFFVEELVARIHSLVRRSQGKALNVVEVGDLTVNLMTRDVRRGDRIIELTAREFSLLEYLIRSPGRVYTRTQILEQVWGYDFDPQTNLVDVYVKRLRNKVDQENDVRLIETVRGVGYRIREQP